jgi:glycine cleavage system H lipoate-binding protein
MIEKAQLKLSHTLKEAPMKTTQTSKPKNPKVFHLLQDQCVWSQAGVIKPVKCMNAFNCLDCTFDQKVQADFQAREKRHDAKGLGHTAPRLRLLVKELKCRHMLSGRVSYKLCAHGYNCVKCPYDQMIEDAGLLPAPTQAVCENVAGFDVAQNYYYLNGHTWARVEYGGRVRIGIDDFAQRMLGPQDRIELPSLGKEISQNTPHVVLRRGSKAAEARSPIDGTVVAVNPKLNHHAEIANADPYNEGWLMLVQPNKLRNNLKNLFFGTESLAWIDDEANQLSQVVSETSGYAMAAAGGEVTKDIYGSVPGLDWDALVERFL